MDSKLSPNSSSLRRRYAQQGRRPFELTWPVAEHHEWIEGKLADWQTGLEKKKSRFLIGTGRTIYYKPLEEQTGLFKNFADSDATEPIFQQFANLYGMLGVPCMVTRRQRDEVISDAE